MVPTLRDRVVPSVQRALAGEITPQMRAVAVDWSPEVIEVRVYTDGEASEDTKADFDAGAITQVVADFSFPDHGDPAVRFSFERCDAPTPIPSWGLVVYTQPGVPLQPGTPAVG